MIFSYLKIAVRTLLRNKLLSLINIIGLTVGMTASLLILLYIRHETSFDLFHKNNNRVYRIVSEATMPGSRTFRAPTALGHVAPSLLRSVPQVENAVRLYQYGTTEIESDGKRFTELKFFWADSTFFQVFSFPLIAGDSAEALSAPNSLVISQRASNILFGTENPVHKTVKMYGKNYTITALAADPPETSSIKFDLIGSFSTLDEKGQPSAIERDGVSFFTFLLLRSDNNTDITRQKIIHHADSVSAAVFKNNGIKIKTTLQPFSEIHLNPEASFEPERSGNKANVIMFGSLALFILLIAVVNYINLFTVRGDRRAKEIGLRKVVGAHRSSIIGQFVGESILTTSIALVIAIAAVELLRKPFGQLMDVVFTESIISPALLITAVSGAVVTGLVAGAWPAFYLSRFQPAVVLKSGLSGRTRHGYFFQKALVTFQFAIAMFMLISLGVMNHQISFLKNKSYGFNKENVLILKNLTSKIRDSYSSLKGEFMHSPGIVSVTASQSYPGQFRSIQTAYIEGQTPDEAIKIHENRVQPGYLETLGMTLTEGQSFDAASAADSGSAILNQAAVKALGLKQPVGSTVMIWKRKVKIAGVVSDYHFLSLHSTIEPLVLTRYSAYFDYIIVRTSPGADLKTTEAFLTQRLKETDPIYSPDIFYLDQSIRMLYDSEYRSSRLISIGTLLAVIISVTGLFALSAFILRQRIKEVGVRKTFGAGDGQILTLLNTSFAKWVVLAAIPAWPAAWMLMDNWLSGFSYTAPVPWHFYPLSLLITLVVALVTTIIMSFRMSRMNPAEALRYE